MKKRNIILNAITCISLTLGFFSNGLAEDAGDQEKLIEELKDKGINIGRLSDSPFQERDGLKLSDAEVLLWETEQLANIKKPGTIRYEFERKSATDDGFVDIVELDIQDVRDDGMKSALVNFFTGDRHQDVPPNENTNMNPILGVYLQGDVYEMNRLTDGNWRYFHRRIKFALAENAKVEPMTINIDGQELAAKKVTFAPYVDDPKRKLFEDYADKIYEIIVSDEVPGMLYEIKTIIPAKNSDAADSSQNTDKSPLVEETLVYAGLQEE